MIEGSSHLCDVTEEMDQELKVFPVVGKGLSPVLNSLSLRVIRSLLSPDHR